MRTRASLLVAVLIAAGCGHSRRATPTPELPLLRQAGSFAVVYDTESDRPVAAIRFNRPIRAAVADGRGGWFVGGGFIHAGGKLRKRLVRIRSDGTLDPSWHPAANGNGVSVGGLALAGSRLYVSGDFERVNGRSRIFLAAVDARTGTLLPWTFAGEAPGFGALDVSGGAAIVGSAGGQLAAVAAEAATRWTKPIGVGLEGGGVRQFSAAAGRVYIEGMFDTIDRAPRIGLAALDAGTGTLVRAWHPRFGVRYCLACTSVEAIAAARSRVYVSSGRQLPPPPAGVPRTYSRLYALDAATGRIDRRFQAATNAASSYGSSVLTLLVDGGRLYVGGTFTTIGGRRRRGFAVLDAATGRVLRSWAPTANSSSVSVIARSGSKLLLGVDLSPQVAFSINRVPYGPVVDSRRYQTMTGIVAVSGPGRVVGELGRIPAGRSCTTDARCPGPTIRRVEVVYPTEATKRVVLPLRGLGPARYFVRFTVRGRGAPAPERAIAYPFRLE